MADSFVDQKAQVVAALNAAGAKLPCPRCGNAHFALVDGYINQPVQQQLGGLVIGGPSVPAAMTVCTQCGFLAQHALGVLNLLPKPVESAEVKK
jgi:ribosomal protein S27AE